MAAGRHRLRAARTGRELFPHARRLLLISWGEWAVDATAQPLRRGIGLGQIDYYVLKPWRTADELFHRTVTEFLHEWVGSDASCPAS